MKILKPGETPKDPYTGYVLDCHRCKCKFEIQSEMEVRHDAGIDASTACRHVRCPSCRTEITF